MSPADIQCFRRTIRFLNFFDELYVFDSSHQQNTVKENGGYRIASGIWGTCFSINVHRCEFLSLCLIDPSHASRKFWRHDHCEDSLWGWIQHVAIIFNSCILEPLAQHQYEQQILNLWQECKPWMNWCMDTSPMKQVTLWKKSTKHPKP